MGVFLGNPRVWELDLVHKLLAWKGSPVRSEKCSQCSKRPGSKMRGFVDANRSNRVGGFSAVSLKASLRIILQEFQNFLASTANLERKGRDFAHRCMKNYNCRDGFGV